MYDALLKPFQLKHLTLRNRIMSTAHEPSYTDKARLTERYKIYHVEKAKGGIGLTMFGGSCCVSPDSPASFGQLACMDDSVITEFQDFSNRVHEHGAALMTQLTHMGRRTGWDTGDWLTPIAPFPIREPAHRSFPKQMELHDIERVKQDFAKAVWRCKEGGLDGVELSAAHEHLIDQFWSPAVNKRTDKYGGDLQNRMRFGLEVLETVRKEVGDDYIVGMRVSGDELLENGLSPDECLTIARAYAETGMLDFINVVGGSAPDFSSLANAIPEMWSQLSPFVYLASAIKQAVSIPIFHAQRIPDVTTAARIVEEGHVDLIGMTRAHIADPHLVNKLLEDRVDDIRQCVGAGYCIDRIYIGKDALCIQNPATGREQTMPHIIRKATNKIKVVIAGAGPAGLEAARVCSARGHTVILFEKENQLGGQINIAAKAPWRESLNSIVRWLEQQLQKHHVDIRLNTEANAEQINNEQPDVVIIATGGYPNSKAWIKGGELALSTWQVLSGKIELKENILIYDDHAQHQGLSCAEFMSQRCQHLEFVTPDRLIGEDVGATNVAPHLRNLYDAGVIFSTDLRLIEIYREEDKLIAVFKNEFNHKEEERVLDQIVVEHGALPVDELYFSLVQNASNGGALDIPAILSGRPQPTLSDNNGSFRLYRLGDAVSSRNIHAALYDALRLCKDL